MEKRIVKVYPTSRQIFEMKHQIINMLHKSVISTEVKQFQQAYLQRHRAALSLAIIKFGKIVIIPTRAVLK